MIINELSERKAKITKICFQNLTAQTKKYQINNEVENLPSLVRTLEELENTSGANRKGGD